MIREQIGLLEDFGDAVMALAEAAIADALDDFFTASVGRVVSVSADGKFASVQAYPKIWQTDEDGNRVGVLMAPLPHVRVLWPGGKGTHVLQWDLQTGDEVLILWTKFDSSTTIKTGEAVDPDTVAQNHPSFAVCQPLSWRAGAGPTVKLARDTDIADCGTLSLVQVDIAPGRVITGTYIPPVGAPQVFTLSGPIVSMPTLEPATVTLDLKGKVAGTSAVRSA